MGKVLLHEAHEGCSCRLFNFGIYFLHPTTMAIVIELDSRHKADGCCE